MEDGRSFVGERDEWVKYWNGHFLPLSLGEVKSAISMLKQYVTAQLPQAKGRERGRPHPSVCYLPHPF
jgi:hypothetical protein